MAYVPLKGGELVAIDLNEGAVKWKVALTTAFTPATGDGLVFAADGDHVIALDQRKGDALWRSPLHAAIVAPLFWDSGWLIASTETGELVALHGENGRVLWRSPVGSPLAVPPTPVHDRLYAALVDGRLVAVELDTGATVWFYPLEEAVTGLLALDDQLLVGTRANLLRSIGLARGRIRWTQRAGADIAGTPTADDQQIYFAALDNVLRAVDRRSGNLRWSRPLPSRPASGPLRAGDVVLVPFTTTDIGAFSAKTGAPSFTIRAVGEIAGIPFLRESPRPTAPRLIALSREGALQGFASRYEPPPATLQTLPGVKVTGGW